MPDGQRKKRPIEQPESDVLRQFTEEFNEIYRNESGMTRSRIWSQLSGLDDELMSILLESANQADLLRRLAEAEKGDKIKLSLSRAMFAYAGVKKRFNKSASSIRGRVLGVGLSGRSRRNPDAIGTARRAVSRVTDATIGLRPESTEVKEAIRNPRSMMLIELSNALDLTEPISFDDCKVLEADVRDHAELGSTWSKKAKQGDKKELVVVYYHRGSWIVRISEGTEILVGKNSPAYNQLSELWQNNRSDRQREIIFS